MPTLGLSHTAKVLDLTMQSKKHAGIYLAGQMTGVEGYLESAAIGIVAGLNAHRQAAGQSPVLFGQRRNRQSDPDPQPLTEKGPRLVKRGPSL